MRAEMQPEFQDITSAFWRLSNCQILPVICCSRVAQWKRAGPITQRSVDRNHALLEIFLTFSQWQRNMGPLAECWSVGVVVITSALHAEGRQFDPGTDHGLL